MNRYERQAEIDFLMEPNQGDYAIVGAGGIGSWLAVFLTLAGARKLILFDPDDWETNNLNRVPIVPDKVGENKAETVKKLCQKLRPGISITAIPEEYDSLYLAGLEVQMVVAADNVEVLEKVREDYPHALDLSCNQNAITVSNENTAWTDTELDEGYGGIPQWVFPQVLSAILGVYSLRTQTPLDRVATINIGNLREWFTEQITITERVVTAEQDPLGPPLSFTEASSFAEAMRRRVQSESAHYEN